MRELDAVLERFLERGYPSSSEQDKARFEALLELPDPDLYSYLIGGHEPADRDIASLLARIRSSVAPRT
jgi:antitoxin CptB